MCSLTNEMRVFRPKDPSTAVVHRSEFGPSFRSALAVVGTMNNWCRGWSATEGDGYDDGQYCVPADSRGNSVLTGDNANFFGFGGTGTFFTCTGLEVFLIQ